MFGMGDICTKLQLSLVQDLGNIKLQVGCIHSQAGARTRPVGMLYLYQYCSQNIPSIGQVHDPCPRAHIVTYSLAPLRSILYVYLILIREVTSTCCIYNICSGTFIYQLFGTVVRMITHIIKQAGGYFHETYNLISLMTI